MGVLLFLPFDGPRDEMVPMFYLIFLFFLNYAPFYILCFLFLEQLPHAASGQLTADAITHEEEPERVEIINWEGKKKQNKKELMNDNEEEENQRVMATHNTHTRAALPERFAC